MEHCNTYIELLSARLDNQLTGEEERALDAHLDSCLDCRALAGQLAQAHAAFADFQEYDAPQNFARGVMEQISATQAKKKKVVPLFAPSKISALAGLAACCVLCVGIYHSGLWRGYEPNQVTMGSTSDEELTGQLFGADGTVKPVIQNGLDDGDGGGAPSSGDASAPEQATPGNELVGQGIEKGVDSPPAAGVTEGTQEIGYSITVTPNATAQPEPGTTDAPVVSPCTVEIAMLPSAEQEPDVSADPQQAAAMEQSRAASVYEVAGQTVHAILILPYLPEGGQDVLGESALWLADEQGCEVCIITGTQMDQLMTLCEADGQAMTGAATNRIGPDERCALLLGEAQ